MKTNRDIREDADFSAESVGRITSDGVVQQWDNRWYGISSFRMLCLAVYMKAFMIHSGACWFVLSVHLLDGDRLLCWSSVIRIEFSKFDPKSVRK